MMNIFQGHEGQQNPSWNLSNLGGKHQSEQRSQGNGGSGNSNNSNSGISYGGESSGETNQDDSKYNTQDIAMDMMNNVISDPSGG